MLSVSSNITSTARVVELRGAVFSIGGQYSHQSFFELSVPIAKE